MKLVLEKAADFQKSIEAIAVLIDEAEFVVDENGMALKATDPSQISMVDFILEKKAFKKFDTDGKLKIGLDLDYLRQIMSRAKADDQLTLELDEGNSRLNVSFKGASARKFNLPLIDISSADLPNPKIEFDADVKLLAGVLQDALKDASLVSSHVSLGVNGDNFVVKAESSKGNLDSVTEKDKKNLIELNVKGEAMSMFPLDYLQDMLKTAQSATPVELNMKNNAPIQVSYGIGAARIKYFLAPRIES
jgi:proliferating cell nuclear antigen